MIPVAVTQGNALELLAPAKNADYGIEAIRHGADAVYIGAPAFGARSTVGNTVEEIGRLAEFAHLYGAKVYVALNTILTDAELPEARLIAYALYEAGADALIVQDFGLLQGDLPPIPLHASTQMDNVTVERCRFLASLGMEQIVMPRELSPAEIARIHREIPQTRIECFVHGALCVSYSGRCYAASSFHRRSANRGSCSQVCRLPFDLIDARGRVLQSHKHLLSVKDLNRTPLLSQLIEAGVRSFKIEGRLKDLSYLKSVTAHYHLRLNEYISSHPEFHRTSHGEVELGFEPDVERVFNRGYTSFAQRGRGSDDLAAFDTPKSMGKRVGVVCSLKGTSLQVQLADGVTMANGDGLSYHLPEGGTAGLRVNVAEGNRLQLNSRPSHLPIGTPLYRSSDVALDKMMERNTAHRTRSVDFALHYEGGVLRLSAKTSCGTVVEKGEAMTLEPAHQGGTDASVRSVLEKCGGTAYRAGQIEIGEEVKELFVPRGALTHLRREVLLALDEALRQRMLVAREAPIPSPEVLPYPEAEVGYTSNVYNDDAEAFYRQHGAVVRERAFETDPALQGRPVMYTKHCIKYSLGLCPHLQKSTEPVYEPWVLRSKAGEESLRIEFDCKACQMVLHAVK